MFVTAINNKKMPPPPQSAANTNRINRYKNQALDNTELRRRREEAGVQIRKTKREEQVA